MVDIAPPKRINGLPVVADAKQVAVSQEQSRQFFLQIVGVLILVNQDVLKQFLIPVANPLMVAQQVADQEQNIVKVHRIAVFQFLIIERVRLGNPDVGHQRFFIEIGFGPTGVFGAGNPA